MISLPLDLDLTEEEGILEMVLEAWRHKETHIPMNGLLGGDQEMLGKWIKKGLGDHKWGGEGFSWTNS